MEWAAPILVEVEEGNQKPEIRNQKHNCSTSTLGFDYTYNYNSPLQLQLQIIL